MMVQPLAPEEVIPEEVVPLEVTPKAVSPGELIRVKVIPEKVIREEVILEEVILEEVIRDEVIPEEVIPEESIRQGVIIPEEEVAPHPLTRTGSPAISFRFVVSPSAITCPLRNRLPPVVQLHHPPQTYPITLHP